MVAKLVVVSLLLVIIGSLGSGLYFVMRDDSGSNRAVKALSWRIGLSILAFVFLLVAGWAGWIEPNTAGARG
jgi:hypothetical protein